jgi:type III restriction enzyme
VVLKTYQLNLLDDFEAFLQSARDLKDPTAAFKDSTRGVARTSRFYTPFPGDGSVPYVCLRVPTGGGKTLIGGHAIQRFADTYLNATTSLTLWLVPSDPIREQTLHALRSPGSLLHDDLREMFGQVNVLDIEEALTVQPATLNDGHTVIVTTMQAFKSSADELRVYRSSGDLMSHFAGTSLRHEPKYSLAAVIRSRRPLIIVDEAHNQGTALALFTLAKLAPSCVLELTATPDRTVQPSNVLRSVSASALQSEDMIKLPLQLATNADWKIALTEAVSKLRSLEKQSAEEVSAGGVPIGTIVMLIQAERRASSKETFTPERVKQILLTDFNVPEEKIAVATGALDELRGLHPTDPDYPQFVITVEKLREGWDCPNAYILFSFRNTTSATAVEQILGRVLRMPGVTRKKNEALNQSYAFAVSTDMADVARALSDGLVQSGFERFEAGQGIQMPTGPTLLDLLPREVEVPLPSLRGKTVVPSHEALASLSDHLKPKVVYTPGADTITISSDLTDDDLAELRPIFPTAAAARTFETEFQKRREVPSPDNTLKRPQTPAEEGVVARFPLLAAKQGELLDVFDETVLLEGSWELSDFDPKLTENDLAKDVQAMNRVRLSMSELEKIQMDTVQKLDGQLELIAMEEGWSAQNLVLWLDQNIPFPYANRDQKVAWFNAALEYLQTARSFTVEELAFRKFRLRAALRNKLAEGLRRAKQDAFDGALSEPEFFRVRDEFAVEFKLGRYAYDTAYNGSFTLNRHFFPVIGDLKPKGEEFECARIIANDLTDVKWWIRNTERKPHSFWLQTSSDRFYPDFVAQLTDGVLVAIEYKGGHLASNLDSREKKQVGELWEARSGGRCRFVWVEDKDWNILHEKTKAVETAEV